MDKTITKDIDVNQPVSDVLRERLSDKDLETQRQLFSSSNIFSKLLDLTPSCLVVLDEYRQIVYANKAVLELFDNKDLEPPYGKRPGELLNCKRAYLTPFGCGTTEFCDSCGGLKVILSSLKGEEDIQECRIIQKDTNDALDLRVWGQHLTINNQNFLVFTFVDISHEKRRQALERIFFHDVLNSAGGLNSFINLFKEGEESDIKEMVPMASDLVSNLLEEIKSQRALVQAENSDLIVNIQSCNSYELINNLYNLYSRRVISEDKIIRIEPNFSNIDFISDRLLISRVLRNMIKNAVESTHRGGVITLGCTTADDKVKFFVNNPGHIPRIIQQQIFMRSFSTKGTGRGLGTYSMRLLTEQYLKGKTYFTSTEDEGTTFFAEYPLK